MGQGSGRLVRFSLGWYLQPAPHPHHQQCHRRHCPPPWRAPPPLPPQGRGALPSHMRRRPAAQPRTPAPARTPTACWWELVGRTTYLAICAAHYKDGFVRYTYFLCVKHAMGVGRMRPRNARSMNRGGEGGKPLGCACETRMRNACRRMRPTNTQAPDASPVKAFTSSTCSTHRVYTHSER